MEEELLLRKRVKLVQRAFGTSLVDRDGVNVAVSCVNKKCSTYGRESKKKLVLRIDNEFYHCWTCGMRGKGLANFFSKYKPNFSGPAKELFSKKVSEVEEEAAPTVELPEGFTLLANLPSNADPDLKACRNYLLRRGLRPRDLWYFKFGGTKKGRFRRRVIIPSFDSEGHLNYFTARAIDDDVGRKYMNPKTKRSDIIFNELNIDWGSPLTIVEGPFDLVKANQNATCLLGSSLGQRHVLFQQIAKNKTEVILALDHDAQKKTHRLASDLSKFGINVRILKFREYEDVGEMPVGYFDSIVNNAEEWNDMQRLMSLINNIKSGSLV